MQIGPIAALLIWTISIASILCMLWRPRGIAEAYWACGGAVILVVFRLVATQYTKGWMFISFYPA